MSRLFDLHFIKNVHAIIVVLFDMSACSSSDSLAPPLGEEKFKRSLMASSRFVLRYLLNKYSDCDRDDVCYLRALLELMVVNKHALIADLRAFMLVIF